MKVARRARQDATRLWRVCLINGRPDAGRVRHVVDGLTETRRTGAAAVLAHFLRLVRLDAARWAARVDTAAPLELAERTAVHAVLVERYGTRVETVFAVDPALIGGMRVRVGGDVYDGSIQARLAAIDARF
jgi:F-type H+-transporting ATPase subunit delta